MLQNTLQKIGLTEKEAKIYLASLELGSSPASSIAEKAKMNRVTAYDILEKLIQKGFISFYTRKKIRFFSPIDPEIMVKEVKRHTEDLMKSLPDLRRIHGKTNHPSVQYFEGLEGIKTIYSDTLKSKTEILNYANSKEVRLHWPNYDNEYVAERVKKKIYLRGIAPYDEYGIKVKNEDQKKYREIRLIPAEEFLFTNEINIYDDKVAIISFKDELIGMIIESHEIANTQRAIFKMAWEFAGRMIMQPQMKQ
ncbi:hypothetical protein HYV57_03125 [Candidatus Peregrinibacteria bacterium]|nr:hypothetical protein [Candidatus Peregrinibacteria bacterium]